jgi:hypothetical protein
MQTHKRQLLILSFVMYLIVVLTSCAALRKYGEDVGNRVDDAVEYVNETPITEIDWKGLVLYVLLGIGSLGAGAAGYKIVKLKKTNTKENGIL